MPSSLRENLDDQGHYTIPSFIDRTIRRGQQECWVIDQAPAPSTVITCPQTVVVELYYTCSGTDEHMARLPIEVVDVTPPTISFALDSNVTPHVTFGGVTRFVNPTAVLPIIDIEDSCDANPDVEATLDGQPYVLGTPITNYGLHFLSISTNDASDNAADGTVVFEIRERPSHSAAAVVEDTSWEVSSDGQSATFRATVLISSATFDHHDIYLESVRLVLRDQEGEWMAAQAPIKIPPIDVCYLAASINDCYVEVEFEEVIEGNPQQNLPSVLDIVGVGLEDDDITFEWGVSVPNVADATPVATLLAQVGKQQPCGNPGQPQPPLPVGCQKIETYISGLLANCVSPFAAGVSTTTPGGCIGASGGASTASARAAAIQGKSDCSVTALPPGLNCVANSSCFASSSAALVVQLVGNCCNCAITFNAAATIKASASVTGTGTFLGSATGLGKMDFLAPCGTGTITANAALANVTGPVAPINLVVPGTFSCTDNACTSMLALKSLVHVSTLATATGLAVLPSNCDAKARVNGYATNISATATANPCPPNECD